MGCRGCQVACKQWNDLPAEKTKFFAGTGGYQNPPRLSANTYTLVGYTEISKGSDLKWVFAKRQCMHCLEPACVSACPVGALKKMPEGPVVYEPEKCMGCRYCMMACPFGVPTYEWSKAVPYIKKCKFCANRIGGEWFDENLNGRAMSEEEILRYKLCLGQPICIKTCSSGALKFGDRDELIAEARSRIAANPSKYINHIYGEREAGGTSWMYISGVPFGDLGFPENVGERPYPSYTETALESVPVLVAGGGAVLAGIYWVVQRRIAAKHRNGDARKGESA
jgi:formate dehydrogenase iron-sulfur subunit